MRPSVIVAARPPLSIEFNSLRPEGEVPRKHPLLARVNLINNMIRRVRVPRIADIIHNGGQHPLLQQARLLDRVDVQTGAHVPRNVAVEGPRAGVVGVVLQDDVSRLPIR